MHPELIESMRDQACIIYRAVTGSDISDLQPLTSESEAPLEEVTRSFAELEAMTRANPSLAERVPPFSFTPPLDVIIEEEGLLVEVAVPGTERKDISVECENDTLVISGIRRTQRPSERTYSHGEIEIGSRICDSLTPQIRDSILEAAREQLKEGIRDGVQRAVHDRLREAFQSGLAQMQAAGGDAEQLITTVRDRVGDEIERRVMEGVKERLREAVREGLEEAVRQRLQSAVRTAVSERLMSRQFGGAGPQFGSGAQRFGATGAFGQTGWGGMSGASGASVTLVSALRERIASNLREGAKEDLRDRLESMLTEALETTRHERLDSAIREALAEQIALGSGFDVEQIAETVRDRIADHLAYNLAHKIQERLGEVLREHLVQAVRHVTSQGGMQGEAAASTSAMGLH